jgi:hypothetical protein
VFARGIAHCSVSHGTGFYAGKLLIPTGPQKASNSSPVATDIPFMSIEETVNPLDKSSIKLLRN